MKAKPRSSARKSRPNDYWFDKAAADRAELFFGKYLKHVKGEWAGQPVELEKWQRDDIICPLFGWKRGDIRKYRTCYVEVPRKNGKSTLGAGVALYLLFCDNEPGAEIYSAAADRDQAAIIFGIAGGMVEANEQLATRSQIFKRAIVAPRASSYKVLSEDVPTKHGLNPHGIIFDELHTQPNRDLYDVLHTGLGARRQPVEFIMTTAGFDRHSICWELHDYAIKVRDGIIQDDTFLPVLYAADETDDWKLESTWKKANPNFGVSVKPDFLRAECKQAQEQPAKENTFKRLHLNIWTEQDIRWMPMEKWQECGAVEIDEAELEGQQCFAGLDLASTTDIAACILLFPPSDACPKWAVICRFWVPEDGVAKRARKDRVPYDAWAKQGFITPTPGNIIDYDFIRRDIQQLAERFNIREIAFDRWAATQLSTQLSGDGLTMVPFGQGFASLSAPTKELMKLVLSKELAHGNNPVLNWMASNVTVRQDPAGNLKPDKGRSTEKIDGIVALIMALGRGMVTPVEGESVYESRGVLAV